MNSQKILNGCDVVMRFSFYALIYFLPISIALVEASASFALLAFFVKRGFLFGQAWKNHGVQSPGQGGRLFLQIFKPVPSSLNLPLGIFILVNLVSVICSQHYVLSLQGFFFKLLQGVYVYFTFIEAFVTKKHLKIFLKVFFVSAAVICVNGIVQYFTGKDFIFGQELMDGRVRSSLRHPNDFGSYLLVVAPMTMAFLLLAFLPQGVWGNSRARQQGNEEKLTGAFKLGVVLLFVAILIFWSFIERKYIPIFILIMVLFWQVFLPQMELTRKVSFITDDTPKQERFIEEANIREDDGFLVYWQKKFAVLSHFQGMGRKIFWGEAMQIFEYNPIFGSGLNTYSKISSVLYMKGGGYPHNCYLQMAAEIGLVGLLSFLWIIYVVCREVIRTIKKNSATFFRAFLVGLFIGLVAFLIHSFFDTNLYSVQLANFFWLILGVIMAVQKIVQEDSRA